MGFFTDGLISAFRLIAAMDAELLGIIAVSLKISAMATLAAGALGMPAGVLIALREFAFKRAVITILNTLLSVPTVVIGLFVYAFISRRSVFGAFDLLYTPNAIIIGQIILIFPIVATFTLSAVSRIDPRYRMTALTLGATGFQAALAVIREARFGIVAAFVAAFGRVISEIGISMMLGGNIKGFTRTMTTAMALEYDKGAFSLAMALGIILLGISLTLNILLQYFQGKVSQ
jgi:tungstate transport system permease protein